MLDKLQKMFQGQPKIDVPEFRNIRVDSSTTQPPMPGPRYQEHMQEQEKPQVQDSNLQQPYIPIEEEKIVTTTELAQNQQVIFDRINIVIENQLYLNNKIERLEAAFKSKKPVEEEPNKQKKKS